MNLIKLFALLTASTAPVWAAGALPDRCPTSLPTGSDCMCIELESDDLFEGGRRCEVYKKFSPSPRKPGVSELDEISSTSSNAPYSAAVRPSGNNRAWILLEAMKYEIGKTGVSITVPAGFVTDYASIPEELWSFYSPHDQYSRAAVIHDYLYWSQLCTRLQADNIFMIAMKESEVPNATRNVVYWTVRGGGAGSWEQNSKARLAKRPKVMPLGRKDFPPNWTWERYRDEILVKQNVTDPVFSDDNYCVLGRGIYIPNEKYISPKSSSDTRIIQERYAIPKTVERRKSE